MTTLRTKRLIEVFTIVIAILYGLPAHAQLAAAVKYKLRSVDTTATNGFDYSNVPSFFNAGKTFITPDKNSVANENSVAFIERMESHLSTRQERKALMGYLKELSTDNNEISYNRSKVKVYYRLANVFARLRLYPLAMKCFFKTLQYKRDKQSPKQLVGVQADTLLADTAVQDIDGNYLTINAKDDSVFVNDPNPTDLKNKKEQKSKSITYNRILGTFNDGKKAAAYALLFHVKQPRPGKPQIYVLNNTGHAFITLIKYNTDSTSVSLSFGFYPQKDNPIFSATPWDPSCTGTFKNDNGHNWDEVIGKFISKRRFEKILMLTKSYDGLEYHLSKNNCTDFALKAASFAGLGVSNSKGSWPLGSGNNPAITGQSILAGEIHNTDGKTGLYVGYDTVLKQK
ncbi:MAG TPA: hypothetical protein VIM77_05480 [Mucilaginibacter sp.]